MALDWPDPTAPHHLPGTNPPWQANVFIETARKSSHVPESPEQVGAAVHTTASMPRQGSTVCIQARPCSPAAREGAETQHPKLLSVCIQQSFVPDSARASLSWQQVCITLWPVHALLLPLRCTIGCSLRLLSSGRFCAGAGVRAGGCPNLAPECLFGCLVVACPQELELMIYNWKPYFTLKDSVMDPRCPTLPLSCDSGL